MSQQHCPSCGAFLAVRTSHTAKNPNRKFVTCHNVKNGRECNYFKWLEGAQLLVSVPPKRSEWLEEIDESPASLGAPQSSVEFNPNQSTDQVEGGSPSGAGQSEQERERGAIIRENKTKPLSDSTANESVPDTSGIVSGLAFLSKSNHTEPQEATKPSKTWSKYQEDIFSNFESGSGNLRIEAVAGCLAGDTMIEVNRAGKSYKTTIDHLVEMVNGGTSSGKQFDQRIITNLRSVLDDENLIIGLNPLFSGVKSGYQKTLQITTESGHSIRATLHHKFLTAEGWKELMNLRIGDYLYVDGGKGKLTKKETKNWYRRVAGMRNHPYRHYSKPHWCVWYHRLVAEAMVNSLTFDELVAKIRQGDLTGLIFLNSKTTAVHHKDENHRNNDPANLEVMTNRQHYEHHALNGGWMNNQARAVPSKIVSIENAKFEMTYDLTMADEKYPNFLANGIVVHNSGKTTSTAEASKRLSKNLSIKFMVFSKANQLDMADKVPSHVEATTAHASGYADIRRQYPDVKLEERKTYLLLDRRYEYNDQVKHVGSEIAKLVSLCKNTLKEPTAANLDYLCDRFGIVANGQQDVIYDAVSKLYQDSQNETSLIDFDDMIHWPAIGKVSVSQSDVLIVDEAQDTNAAQQAFYLQAVKSSGRLIFVGDTHQAIFGFRGADTSAMDNLSKVLSPNNLPLSICYRCGHAMVELAKSIVPQIEAWDNAPDGKVSTVTETQFSKSVQYGDMVLCRLNAPLVKPAFDLIRQGKKATIRGRDIGKGLTNLLRKMQKRAHRTLNLNEMISDLAKYTQHESAKLIAAHKENQADTLQDQFETLLALSDGCYAVSDLERRISQVFSDEAGDGVVFSTIHKAKGLEANRVYILKPELLPFPRAKAEWQIEQERNLTYVSYTRARQELIFVR